MLASNSIAALCDFCCCAVASASCASTLACSASWVAGCASLSAAAFSARDNLSRAAAISTGANSGAPDRSARATDDLATAIFSLGMGVLAHPAAHNASAAQRPVPLVHLFKFNISMLLFLNPDACASTLYIFD